MNTKLILAFVLGLITGAGGVGIFLKNKHEKELDEIYVTLEDIQQHVNESDELLDKTLKRTTKTLKEAGDNMQKFNLGKMLAFIDDEEDPDDMEDEDEEASDLDVDDPEKLYPDPELPLEKVDVENTVVDENREWSVKVKKEKPIHNISGDEYFNDDDLYAKIGIQYYPGTGMYLDLDGDEVKDHEGLIGKGLLFFGLNSGDKDVVYIRNTIKKIDIEVVRMEE